MSRSTAAVASPGRLMIVAGGPLPRQLAEKIAANITTRFQMSYRCAYAVNGRFQQYSGAGCSHYSPSATRK